MAEFFVPFHGIQEGGAQYDIDFIPPPSSPVWPEVFKPRVAGWRQRRLLIKYHWPFEEGTVGYTLECKQQ
jgi:hypothetical protein